MSDKNQNYSLKEPYINFYEYQENFQKSKSFNALSLFNQEDEKNLKVINKLFNI